MNIYRLKKITRTNNDFDVIQDYYIQDLQRLLDNNYEIISANILNRSFQGSQFTMSGSTYEYLIVYRVK